MREGKHLLHAVLLRRVVAPGIVLLLALGRGEGTETAPAPAPPEAPAAPAPAETPAAPRAGEATTAPAAPPQTVVALLGIAVHSEQGKEVGRIVDVLVDAAGHPLAAVLDVGGFLGVGSRRVAVEWSALRIDMPPGKPPEVTLAMSSDNLKSAPEYVPAKPVHPMPPSAQSQTKP